METAAKFNRRFKELQRQLRKYITTVEELGPVLDQRVTSVLQNDQAASLDNLKVEVMKEVEDVRMTEIVASNEFNKRKLMRGLMNFAAGALVATVSGKGAPLSRGGRLSLSALDQNPPFDTVLVAVGKNGLPEDITVVPVSSLARTSDRSELEIIHNLQENGYLLMGPKVFTTLVENIKRRVIDGSMSLPVSAEKVGSELRDNSAKAIKIKISSLPQA